MDWIKAQWGRLPKKVQVGIVLVVAFLVLAGMMGAYN